jgi:SOS-response transcriptional repressor LexA
MEPLIKDGDILVIGYARRDFTNLIGKIIIAWNEQEGLVVSRLRRHGGIQILESENREYESVKLGSKWKIVAKVLYRVSQN